MKKRMIVSMVAVLVLVLVFTSTVWAATTSKFSVGYDSTGKVVMNNFDSDISCYKSDGVYQQTGSGVTKAITYYVCPRQIAVVGGYKVGGVEGVYKLVGPGTYTETITDGFVIVVDKSVIAKEWQFRLYQVYKNNWLIKQFSGTNLLN